MEIRILGLSCCSALAAVLCACASTSAAVDGSRTTAAVKQSAAARSALTAAQFRDQLEETVRRLEQSSESVIQVDKDNRSITCSCSPSIQPNTIPPVPQPKRSLSQAISVLKLLDEASMKDAAVEIQSR